MTLEELSGRSGLSASFLSLAERGRSGLALTSLFNVASALNVDVAALLPPDEHHPPVHHDWEVVRNLGRDLLPVTIGARQYRFLSSTFPGRSLEPLLVTVYPSQQTEAPFAHTGEEFALVLSGSVVYIVDGEEFPLTVADCFHVPSTTRHALRNDAVEPAEVLWVMSHPLIGDGFRDLLRRGTSEQLSPRPVSPSFLQHRGATA